MVVDPQLPNLTDTDLDLRCLRGKLLSNHEAGVLCDKLSTLFENQGALVRTARGAEVPEGGAAPPELESRTELTVELRARETDESKHPLSWVLFVGTFTLVPGVLEQSFAQDVVIRDESGFLLMSDTLEGRLVQRYGFGPWFGTTILDLTRKKLDRLGKNSASRDLSDDLYGQLSQQVFNAKMRAQVLRQASPIGRTE